MARAKKLRGGHKYPRLQQIDILSKHQKKVLKQFGKKVKPEKFKKTSQYKTGLKLLTEAMKKGPPVSPLEGTTQNFLQNLLSRTPEEQYQNFSAPFLRQFEQQTVPALAQRFASQDALDSSAFQQTLGGAAAGLSENLASLKGNLIDQLLNQQLTGVSQALPFAQLPGQRWSQQLNAAGAAVPMSFLPQDVQRGLNEFAQNQQFQQLQQILGTPGFQMVGIPPTARHGGSRSSIPQIIGGGLMGGALSGALGRTMGAAGMGALMGSAGGPLGSLLGGALGGLGSLFGGGGGGAQRVMGPVSNAL